MTTPRQYLTGIVTGIVVQGNEITAMAVQSPMLVLDLVGWASERATAYRRESVDTDWTKKERREYLDKAIRLDTWIEKRLPTSEISTELNMFLALRSGFAPHTVSTQSELEDYSQTILDMADAIALDELSDPQFVLDIDKSELWVSQSPGLRSVRMHSGPSVRVKPVPNVELEAIIARLTLAKEVNMKEVHRPNYGGFVYGMSVTETDENGVETEIPFELICRAKPTTLKDDNLRWVSGDEDKRLNGILQDAHSETMDSGSLDINDILKAATEEGFEKVSTIFESPDEGFLEHHVLCRNQTGEHIDLVFTHEDYGTDEFSLSDFATRKYDMEYDTMLLRLIDRAEIKLAREQELLCLDDDGYHVQVRVYRSAAWQCQGDDGLNQDNLRQFWARQIRGPQ